MNIRRTPTHNATTDTAPTRRKALQHIGMWGCAACAGMGAGFAWAREGVEVGGNSKFSKWVSADQVENAAAQQYQKMMQEAAAKNALLPVEHPQSQRLRTIAQKIIPFSYEWNPRAKAWKWEVNILNSNQINAFCMPGGKIAFYTGILEQLKLTDDEVAMIMGHEVAHALREHARERMGKNAATNIGANVIGSLLGVGNAGAQLLGMGAQMMTLKFGREDESEADLVGMELAARAGYNPKAGVSLWQKMGAASKGAPPQFLSTHPSGPTRIADIEKNLPKVEPLYQRAPKPTSAGPIAAPRASATPAPSSSPASPASAPAPAQPSRKAVRAPAPEINSN